MKKIISILLLATFCIFSPIAATTVIHEKFFGFGIRKYLTPSRAPGLVTE